MFCFLCSRIVNIVQTGKHEKVAKSKSGEKTTAVMATHLKWFIMPPPHSVRQNALMAVVCLSVCPVPDPKLRMKWHSKLKIAKKRVCHGYPGPHLEVKRSKVKVTRPLWLTVQVTKCRGGDI